MSDFYLLKTLPEIIKNFKKNPRKLFSQLFMYLKQLNLCIFAIIFIVTENFD